MTVNDPSCSADTLIQYAFHCGPAAEYRRHQVVEEALAQSAWQTGCVIDSVGDEHSGHGVLLSAQLRKMELPEIFKSGRRIDDLHYCRLATFTNAVIHDGDSRPKGMHQNFRIRSGLPVMQTKKHVHRAQAVVRAHQFEFLVHREIAQMNRAKPSERNVSANGLRILGIVLSGLEFGAIRIRFSRAGKRGLDRFTGRGHHAHIEAGNSDPVTRLSHRVFALA